MSDKRVWKNQIHKDAGYHEQEWGPIPTPSSDLIGLYTCVHNGKEMGLEVRYLRRGYSGNPELEIEWEDGFKVTVIDEATAVQYLLQDNAVLVR